MPAAQSSQVEKGMDMIVFKMICVLCILLTMTGCAARGEETSETVEGWESIAAETYIVETELVDGKKTEDATEAEFATNETEEVATPKAGNYTEETEEQVADMLRLTVQNPSWDYYLRDGITSDTKPYTLTVKEQKENLITDQDAWFVNNELSLPIDGEYYCFIEEDGKTLLVYREGVQIAELDFSDYVYPSVFKIEDRDFIEENITYAKAEEHVLFISTSHLTYAESAPSNAYITAVDLSDGTVLWKTAPLTCNSYNFEIVGDVIFCGYGFTAEPDYLYQIDKKTGKVLSKETIKSRADYILEKDGDLYVRTYNTDYVFEIGEKTK